MHRDGPCRPNLAGRFARTPGGGRPGNAQGAPRPDRCAAYTFIRRSNTRPRPTGLVKRPRRCSDLVRSATAQPGRVRRSSSSGQPMASHALLPGERIMSGSRTAGGTLQSGHLSPPRVADPGQPERLRRREVAHPPQQVLTGCRAIRTVPLREARLSTSRTRVMAWWCGNSRRTGTGSPSYGSSSSIAESRSCAAEAATSSATHGTLSSNTFHSSPSTPPGRSTRRTCASACWLSNQCQACPTALRPRSDQAAAPARPCPPAPLHRRGPAHASRRRAPRRRPRRPDRATPN